MNYTLLLTGAADATTDIELPISSFTLRLRDSTKDSYLSCTVPNASKYADDIVARSNGNLVLTADWELVDCALTNIRVASGGNSSSVNLTGYDLVSNVSPQSHILENVSYVSTDPAGSTNIRAPLANILPDDTVIYDSVSYTVETIAISVNDNQTQMELSCV